MKKIFKNKISVLNKIEIIFHKISKKNIQLLFYETDKFHIQIRTA